MVKPAEKTVEKKEVSRGGISLSRVTSNGGDDSPPTIKANSRLDPPAESSKRRREEEQEDFVYVVSHNLKTPLAAIQGFANILHEELGPHLSAEHRRFLERLRQNAALMEKMVLNLLEFSRLGHYPFTFEKIGAKTLLQVLIEDMRLLGQLRQADVIFAPVGENEPQLYADGDELRTVFENLLTNAVKYRRPDVPLRIEIGWEEQPPCYAFWVRDNGSGMDEAFQAKAFELFQRGANAGQVQGTGIGLAIVRRIIENHQGTVRLASKLGEGTTISFTLPKRDNPPHSANLAAAE